MSMNISEIPAVILAAGEGSRLRSDGNRLPKPLTPLLGRTLIERAVLTAHQAGIKKFIVVLGYKKEDVLPTIETLKKEHQLSIKVVENPEWRLGNGTSVAAVEPHVSGLFFVVMCDHIFEHSIMTTLVESANKKKNDSYSFLAVDKNTKEVFDPEDTTWVRLSGEKIVDIGKELDNPDAADTGIFLLRPNIFKALKEAKLKGDASLTAGVKILANAGQMIAVDVTGYFWHDVDTKKALKAGERFLLERLKTAKKIDGPISKHINRFFSIKLTKLLAPYPITPNQLSVISTLTGLLGAFCFFLIGWADKLSPLSIWLLVAAGGIIIQISSILDGVDGELARLRLEASPYGAYVDYMLDRYVDGITLMGIVYALYSMSGNFFIIFAGFMALLGLPLSSIHRAKFLAEAKRNYHASDDGILRYIPYSRDVRLFAIFIGSLINRLELVVYFLALIPNSVALLRLYTVKKALLKDKSRIS